MSIARSFLTRFHFTLLGLAYASSVFAAEQAPAQPPPWSSPPWSYWQHPMPWLGFMWVFPLLFFAVMLVMMIFMMSRGGMGHMWHRRMMDRDEFRDAQRRAGGESAESAVEILNKRYAKGEIDKQEYEEKMAAITRTR